MTDDQSIGDFGVNGNEVIRTPHIDVLARQSTSFTQFYVSPVCSPTRACLMTGRYNYRTRVIDTWLGRSMMEPAEVTLAEMLSAGGYATGIFGKWHLGDCYPMRPNDQGFQESLVHRGGGLGQPADPLGNNRRYTNPILIHNGVETPTKGYCTDVYFDAAIDFINQSAAQQRSFFVYLPTNAPHSPYHDVPNRLYQEYLTQIDQLKSLLPDHVAKKDQMGDRLARIAAMITNIDENVGRLRNALKEKGLADNTLFIFLTDNGPAPARFAGPLNGRKTEVREAGVRSPLWIHWPAQIAVPEVHEQVIAHIDLTPTILEACGVEKPVEVSFDGRSLAPLLLGETVDWKDRDIIIQSHRGDHPQRYHNFLIRDSRWKLMNPSGFHLNQMKGPPDFQLYDLQADPGETTNLAARHPQIVQRLKESYDCWFDDVSSTRPDNFAPPRIHLGSPYESETVLTRNEWRGRDWSSRTVGEWLVHVENTGFYQAVVYLEQERKGHDVILQIGDMTTRTPAVDGGKAIFENFRLKAGDNVVQAWTDTEPREGAYQVVISRAKAAVDVEAYPPEI